MFFSLIFSDAKMTAILDQKHYIEELNRHLSCTVTDLQVKMDSLEKTNSKLVEEVRRTVCVNSCVIVVNEASCALGVFQLTDECMVFLFSADSSD